MIVPVRLAALLVLAVASASFAQAPAGSCSDASLSRESTNAKAKVERDPSSLEPRLELAEALTAQQCYQDAVRVLEAGQEFHPQNAVLEGRIRTARSMISEQNYIESVTRAEESARLQRNLLRCRKLSDVEACDEALVFRRNDWELLAAKADAMVQEGRGAEALPVYRRVAELRPNDAATQNKIRILEGQRLVRATAAPAAIETAAPAPAASSSVLARTDPKPKKVSYSNEAPAGRTN